MICTYYHSVGHLAVNGSSWTYTSYLYYIWRASDKRQEVGRARKTGIGSQHVLLQEVPHLPLPPAQPGSHLEPFLNCSQIAPSGVISGNCCLMHGASGCLCQWLQSAEQRHTSYNATEAAAQ